MNREVENSAKKKKYMQKNQVVATRNTMNGSILWMFSRKEAHVEFHTPNLHSKEKGLLTATF